MAEEQAIRIVKKGKKHGGHHGGAWKVAFADFMTAMMAFFLVMWILGLNQETRKAIEGYFNDPIGFSAGYQSGRSPFATTGMAEGGKDKTGGQLAEASGAGRLGEKKSMRQVKSGIEKALKQMRSRTGLAGQIHLRLTSEGLRIELVDRMDAAFFALGSAELNPQAEQLLRMLAEEIAKLPNRVIIEGHTDARQYSTKGYSNWELSFDRANTARLTMKKYGREEQLSQVRAYADTRPRVPEDKFHFSNRRVSLLVQYSDISDGKKPKPIKTQVFKGAGLEPDFAP
ncbi:MAG: membrane protein [Fimbriimonadales bacterium]